MSSTAIFIVGAVVFAITVYGSVMAAGLALTRVELDQNPNLEERPEDKGSKKRSRFGTKY